MGDDQDSYRIVVTHHREGLGPLTQSISCDAETAVTWLAAVAQEIASSMPTGEPPAWRLLNAPEGRRRPILDKPPE